jgi:hypothetical protein
LLLSSDFLKWAFVREIVLFSEENFRIVLFSEENRISGLETQKCSNSQILLISQSLAKLDLCP